jgi:hypothetical protein
MAVWGAATHGLPGEPAMLMALSGGARSMDWCFVKLSHYFMKEM